RLPRTERQASFPLEEAGEEDASPFTTKPISSPEVFRPSEEMAQSMLEQERSTGAISSNLLAKSWLIIRVPQGRTAPFRPANPLILLWREGPSSTFWIPPWSSTVC